MKDKKTYIILGVSILFMAIGISYAYFSLNIIGNDNAKNNKIVTGNLELTFTDTNEISLENFVPGDSVEKVIKVKNTGSKEASYDIGWTDYNNEIIKDELEIEGTCKRLNSSNTIEGTCESISRIPINGNNFASDMTIETGITHEYTLKITFKDTYMSQDYNKNKTFNGKINISEHIKTDFEKDSWADIADNIRNGNAAYIYEVGDTRKIDMGEYGKHVVRIVNMDTPSECSTSGFSQTACGFVLEFADVVTTHAMISDTSVTNNKGGWEKSDMRTFVNNDIYNSLPTDLKNVILDTTVVSNHGSEDTANFVTTDKLYLLALKEIFTDYTVSTDTINNLTRTLDYYTSIGTTTTNTSGAIKNKTSPFGFWTRSVSTDMNVAFYFICSGGVINSTMRSNMETAPAFRIG